MLCSERNLYLTVGKLMFRQYISNDIIPVMPGDVICLVLVDPNADFLAKPYDHNIAFSSFIWALFTDRNIPSTLHLFYQ